MKIKRETPCIDVDDDKSDSDWSKIEGEDSVTRGCSAGDPAVATEADDHQYVVVFVPDGLANNGEGSDHDTVIPITTKSSIKIPAAALYISRQEEAFWFSFQSAIASFSEIHLNNGTAVSAPNVTAANRSATNNNDKDELDDNISFDELASYCGDGSSGEAPSHQQSCAVAVLSK